MILLTSKNNEDIILYWYWYFYDKEVTIFTIRRTDSNLDC